MTQAQAVTDGETVLAAIEVAASPARAFEAMMSAEVENLSGPSFGVSSDPPHAVLAAHGGRRPQYWEKIPNSTRVLTSTNPAAASAATISGGATQVSMVSQ